MNVFIYELKHARRSIMIWSIPLIILTVIFMQFSTIFLDETGGMKAFLSELDSTYTAAIGIDIETFFSEVGFYSYLFTYIGLVAAIQAMGLGLNVISKENRMKTADFLISKPKSRTSIYIAKFCAGMSTLLITQILFYITAYITMSLATNNFNFTAFTLISLSFTFIQSIFFTLGLFVATIITKIKSVTSLTMGIVLSLFLLSMISRIVDSSILIYFSPFQYFDNSYIMLNNAYEAKFLIISIALPLFFSISSYLIYIKKDVPSV